MKKFLERCLFCGSSALYKVSDTQYKCKVCGKKFSYKKFEKEYEIIKAFLQNETATQASQRLHVNYKTLSNKYMDFRKLLTIYLEDLHHQNTNRFSEYDEYYYLPKNKRGKVKYLFESIGILGMLYDEKVYTCTLPDQFSHLQSDMGNKEVHLAYIKEYAKYLNRYKIVHYKKFDSLLVKFWVFLEASLERYKGISKEYFIYYLKECEFKFNIEAKEQQSILWKLWIESL